MLAQFAEDGGNREQALHYHLFSFELCWHTRAALQAAGRTISSKAEDRLTLAAGFLAEVQVQSEPWGYGDSDDSFVLPLASELQENTREWCQWLNSDTGSLAWFLGRFNSATAPSLRMLPQGWRLFPHTGIGVNRTGEWFLRWDVSPLGYLQTA